MGSIAMHLAIGEKIKQKYGFTNKFLVGSILPDILKNIYTKDKSHYLKQVFFNEQILNLPDIEKYVNENNKKLKEKDEITLGYLAHLIEDRIWFRDYSGEFLHKAGLDKNGEDLYTYKKEDFKIIHENKATINKIYSDYNNLNTYILNIYPYDINSIKEECESYFNNNKDYMKIVDPLLTIDNNHYKKNNEYYLFSEEIAKEYINISIKEVEKNIENLINKINI